MSATAYPDAADYPSRRGRREHRWRDPRFDGGPCASFNPWNAPKPLLIAAMILGFMLFWPIGLAVLFFMIGSGRIGRRLARRYGMAPGGEPMMGGGGGAGAATTAHPRAIRPSTNTASIRCAGLRMSRRTSRPSSNACASPRTARSSSSSCRTGGRARRNARNRPRRADREPRGASPPSGSPRDRQRQGRFPAWRDLFYATGA